MDKKVVIPIVVVVALFLAIPLLETGCSSRPSAPAPPAPSSPTSPAPSSEAASPTSVATDFVSALVRGDVAAVTAKLDDAMKAQLPANKIIEGAKGMQAQLGALKGQSAGRINKFSDGDEVPVTCEFERGKVTFAVTVSPSLKVTKLSDRPVKP